MRISKRSLVWTTLSLVMSVFALALTPSALMQQSRPAPPLDRTQANALTAPVNIVIRGGLREVTFDTIQGEVIVNLPDDMRAGDTISGTVVFEPKKPERENRSMSFELLFDTFETVKVPTSGGSKETFTVKIPASSGNDKGTGQIKVALKNKDGLLIQTATVPIAPPIGFVITTSGGVAPPLGVVIAENSAFGNRFTIPVYTQQGRPVDVYGPFDGSFENTKLNVGGQDTTILAESPRKVVFRSPVDSTGPTEITIKEGDKEGKGNLRNVGVKLSAPKTTLLRGERTTLTVQVTGLEGINKPVPLTLEAKGVITMEGGTQQSLVIQPSQVGPDGRYSTTRGITGVQAGGWEATATVVTSPFNIVLSDPNPPSTLFLNSFTGDYVFCSPQGRVSGTGKTSLKGCAFKFSSEQGNDVFKGLIDYCEPSFKDMFIWGSFGITVDFMVTATNTRPPRRSIQFNVPPGSVPQPLNIGPSPPCP